MAKLKGTQITGVRTHFQHVKIKAGDKEYFIAPEELVKVLSEFEFKAETKKTRTWVTIDIDKWKVEKQDEPRS